MPDVQIICAYSHLFPLLDSLREYCKQTTSTVGATVADFGLSQKLVQACIFVTFPRAVHDTFIQRLEADSRIIDYYLFAEEQGADARLPLALVPAPDALVPTPERRVC